MEVALNVHRIPLPSENRAAWDLSIQIITELLDQAVGISVHAPALNSELVLQSQ